MTSTHFYFYVYPEVMEQFELTLFEYSVLEILCYKGRKGTFYGNKDEHIAAVLDSSYDYVCRIIRGLITKGLVKKKRKAVIDNLYDELEVNENWYRHIEKAIEKHNSEKYYKRYQFFPALMVEAQMTLKQYVVSLTTEILQTKKTSRIASFAGVCRQTVYNTFAKFGSYFEIAQTGVKKLTEQFKKMKNVFTQKAVDKEYHQARKESKQFQQTQKPNNPSPKQQATPQAQEESKQFNDFWEAQFAKKQEIDKEKAAQEEAQRQKNQAYYAKVFGSS